MKDSRHSRYSGHSKHSRRRRQKSRKRSFIMLVIAVMLLLAAARLIDVWQTKRLSGGGAANTQTLSNNDDREITNGIRRYRRRPGVESVLLVSTDKDVSKEEQLTSEAQTIRLLVTDKDKSTWQIISLKMDTVPECGEAVEAVNEMLGCKVIDHYAIFDEETLPSLTDIGLSDMWNTYQQLQTYVTTDMGAAAMVKVGNNIRQNQRKDTVTVDEKDKKEGFVDKTILDTFYRAVS